MTQTAEVVSRCARLTLRRERNFQKANSSGMEQAADFLKHHIYINSVNITICLKPRAVQSTVTW